MGSGNSQRSRLWLWWQCADITLLENPALVYVQVCDSRSWCKLSLKGIAQRVLFMMPNLWHTYVITSHGSSWWARSHHHLWALPWMEGVRSEVLQWLEFNGVMCIGTDWGADLGDGCQCNHTRIWCLSFIICTSQPGDPLPGCCRDTE